MQEDDAVVAHVQQRLLDVTHYLFVGVQAVDQCDVDRVLIEECGLVVEKRVAGHLEVVGGAGLRVSEFAGALQEFERRVDGDLHVGADLLESLSA